MTYSPELMKDSKNLRNMSECLRNCFKEASIWTIIRYKYKSAAFHVSNEALIRLYLLSKHRVREVKTLSSLAIEVLKRRKQSRISSQMEKAPMALWTPMFSSLQQTRQHKCWIKIRHRDLDNRAGIQPRNTIWVYSLTRQPKHSPRTKVVVPLKTQSMQALLTWILSQMVAPKTQKRNKTTQAMRISIYVYLKRVANLLKIVQSH